MPRGEPTFTIETDPFGGVTLWLTDEWGDTTRLSVYTTDSGRYINIPRHNLYAPSEHDDVCSIPEWLLIQALEQIHILHPIPDKEEDYATT